MPGSFDVLRRYVGLLPALLCGRIPLPAVSWLDQLFAAGLCTPIQWFIPRLL